MFPYVNSVNLKGWDVNRRAARTTLEPEAGTARFAIMDIEDSAAIRAIRYEATRQRLVVRFIDGHEYVYVGVPGEVHRSFVDAESKGRFFAAEIRDHFPYNRLI